MEGSLSSDFNEKGTGVLQLMQSIEKELSYTFFSLSVNHLEKFSSLFTGCLKKAISVERDRLRRLVFRSARNNTCVFCDIQTATFLWPRKVVAKLSAICEVSLSCS